ncbi:glucosaminidase domain-containing protein [Solitalea canadensis]|uniref:Peptidoglycan hydrolase n=1 Tax=Solitalea canadensis (strain ATCC 29591 / DSM 3403 / JCM 21819 / LMG 8368 / NBRC 15130 / NCIMB 12057 / USAM 9D) TaxID=929556 RepID=H8KX72_SOLCM|nr:glucosaminidase domain-containing protein [Solitalea canadensis]AFD08401.1 muramidase (flagellum-specific) [Solitalea canadensis DSM 3403]
MKKLKLFLLLSIINIYAYGQNRLATTYAKKYGELAVSEMKRTGIPASITLAQGIIESGGGTTSLARKANNHFGVKAGRSWKGKRHGNFRKYETAEEAFDDRSDFLSQKKTYASLFKLDLCDYKGWARGLQKAGYATSKRYATDLIRCIEQNNLHEWDKLVCTDKEDNNELVVPTELIASVDSVAVTTASKPTVRAKSAHTYHKIKSGESLYTIAKKYKTTVNKLKSLNSLQSAKIKPGQRIRIN